MVEEVVARKCEMSSSVQVGWSGMVMSREVMLAARRRPARRGELGRQTARMRPN